jgi:hypothetical protein
MIGTQGYAPPEQYRGKAETRSDLYALGATMHHALSGRDPATEPPFSFPPLRKVAPSVTPALAELVDLALAYDLNRRVTDAAEFKRRLIEIKNGATGAFGPAPTLFPRIESEPTKSGSMSSAAPTVLSNVIDIECPRCGMQVPADSRFCSFCAADLRRVLGPSEVVGDPGAETVILSERQSLPPGAYPSATYSPPMEHERRRRHRGERRAVFGVGTIAALVVAGALAIKLLGPNYEPAGPSPNPDEGSVEPMPEAPVPEPPAPEVPAPAPEAAEPIHRNPREQILRRVLDMQGYRSVHFRVIDGNTVQLWGNVRSSFDRLAVQNITSTLTGVMTLDDRLKVDNSDPDDPE